MSFQNSHLFQEINEKFQALKSALKLDFDEVYYDDRINSRMAKMTCYMVSTSSNFKYTYEQCATRWLQELETIKYIADHCRQLYPRNPINQAIYFVAHVQYYLLYKRLGQENLELSCPYTDGARNFIVSLIETNQCVCTCYSYYVLACAEEFGFEGYVGICVIPAHVFNIVFDPFQGDNGMGVISLDASGNSIHYNINQKYFNIRLPHHYRIWKDVITNLKLLNHFEDLSQQAFIRQDLDFKSCNVEKFEGLLSSFDPLKNEILNFKNGPYRIARLLLLGKLYDLKEIVESAIISATYLQFHWNAYYKIGDFDESKILESNSTEWYALQVQNINPMFRKAISDLDDIIIWEPVRIISYYVQISPILYNLLDRILVPKSYFKIIYTNQEHSCLIHFSNPFTNILITNDTDDFAFYFDVLAGKNNVRIFMSSNCDDFPNVKIIPDLDYVVLVWNSDTVPSVPSNSRKKTTNYKLQCDQMQMQKCNEIFNNEIFNNELQKCWNSLVFDDLSCAQYCESHLHDSLAMIPKIFFETKSIYFNRERLESTRMLELTRMIIIARNKRNRVNLGFILENPKELPSRVIFDDLTYANTMCRDFLLEHKNKSEFVFQFYFPLNQALTPASSIILELPNGKKMEFNQGLTQNQDEICLEVIVSRLVPLSPF